MKIFQNYNWIFILIALSPLMIALPLLFSSEFSFLTGKLVLGVETDNTFENSRSNEYIPLFQVVHPENDYNSFYTTSQIEVLEAKKKGLTQVKILGYIYKDIVGSDPKPLFRMIDDENHYEYYTSQEQITEAKKNNTTLNLDKILGYFPSDQNPNLIALIERRFIDSSKLGQSFYTLNTNDQKVIKNSVMKPNIFIGMIHTNEIMPENTFGYDIMIVAGQSNNKYGIGYDKFTDSVGQKIFQYGRYNGNDKLIIPASEPLDNVLDNKSDRIGYSLTFAKLYREDALKENREILILPAAQGGTSFTSKKWGAEGSLVKDLIERANELTSLSPSNKIVVMFWHQGESDTKYLSQIQYEKNWLEMIKKIENTVEGFDVSTTILVGQMVPSWIGTNQSRIDIDEAHKNLPNLRENTFYVSATYPYEIGLNDEEPLGYEDEIVHFSAPSQRIFGQRFYEVFTTRKSLEKGYISKDAI